jgi:ATP-dependent helicase YprA (DUF1998 family)
VGEQWPWRSRLPDAVFDDPRLAAIYDALDPDRSDLGPYLDMVEELGIRGSALLTGQRVAERLIDGGVQTIVFARASTAVEVLTSYLHETFAPPPGHRGSRPR